MNKTFERYIFVCDCEDISHQFSLNVDTHMYFPKPKDMYQECWIEVMLNPLNSFWRRLWVAFLYVFGRRSKYGDWDVVMIKKEDASKMKDLLDKFLKDNDNG